ncbi:MAG: recombinase family protein [Proteobacteria bacterium]|nr:recombinase family protein [Pseudomonadota bacterium]
MTKANAEKPDLSNKPKIRCAIYTRKSSEDGLEQDFNSIDAQRLSGENFIASQVGKGWILVDDHYDDGGFSGGTLERPALKRLFQDIEENKIDCVVIYKIDRLSRSLFDFQKIIELFDQKKVSFASVTQNFTTDDSVGRLMLNVMLSFAQYERELTGERIRDKVDASKKKGIWMGGTLSLGYNVEDRKLVVNEEEAKVVRILFQIFIETESVAETARELDRHGFVTKSWISRTGKLQRSRKFNKENVRRILENPIYIGKIKHKDNLYDGLHKPIITDEIWQKTKDILARAKDQENKVFLPTSRVTAVPLLKGMMKCGSCGSAVIPTYTKKGSKRYRYYICHSKAVGNNDHCPVGRISATEAEGVIVNRILILLKKPEFVVHTISQSSGIIPESVVINSFKEVEKVWDELFPVEQARIISLLIKEVIVNHDGLKIRIFKEGLSTLSTELTG